jgi:hypothetical protein
MFRHPAFLVALVLMAVVAGCGGSSTASKSDYAASVVNARDRVDFALAQITQSKTKDEFLDQMVASSELIDDAANDFENASSAKGFDDESKKLAKAMHQLAVDLNATAEQIRLPGYEGLLDAKGLNFDSWTAINATLADLNEQGIKVSPLGRH